MGKVGQTKKVKSMDDLDLFPMFDKADRVTILKTGANQYEVTGYTGFRKRDKDSQGTLNGK